MSISYSDSGDLRTITLTGRMDVGGRDSMATQLVDLSAARTKVVVNLLALTMLASIGIRALVISAKSAAARGAKIVLVVDSASSVMSNIRMAGVDQLIPVVTSPEDAERATA